MRNRNKGKKIIGWVVFLAVILAIVYVLAADIETNPQKVSKDISAQFIK